jgi:hypothetical protein
MACDRCKNIPLNIFLGTSTESYVFHLSLNSLKSSADRGCHSCTLIYHSLSWPGRVFNHGHLQDEQAVLLQGHILETPRDSALKVRCGSAYGIVSYAIDDLGDRSELRISTSGKKFC